MIQEGVECDGQQQQAAAQQPAPAVNASVSVQVPTPNGASPAPPAPPAAAPKKEPILTAGVVIKDRFAVGEKLGQGAFGETYAAVEVFQGKTETPLAIKVERMAGKTGARGDVLRQEVIAMRKLQTSDRVVRYRASGRDESLGINFLVMERLGPDLGALRKRAPRGFFEPATTLRLTREMLAAIAGVHALGFIHRDIKPSNFVIGQCRCSRDYGRGTFGCASDRCGSSRVYLIDFGLARRFLAQPKDGKPAEHRPARADAGFRGTARYASVNAHAERELSRRDDLWSLFYVLLEFSDVKGLPWRGEKEKAKVWKRKAAEIHDSAGRLRVRGSESPSDLLADCPQQFSSFMEHLCGLEYESKPDYDYLDGLLKSSGVEWAHMDWSEPAKLMEWQRPHAPKHRDHHHQHHHHHHHQHHHHHAADPPQPAPVQRLQPAVHHPHHPQDPPAPQVEPAPIVSPKKQVGSPPVAANDVHLQVMPVPLEHAKSIEAQDEIEHAKSDSEREPDAGQQAATPGPDDAAGTMLTAQRHSVSVDERPAQRSPSTPPPPADRAHTEPADAGAVVSQRRGVRCGCCVLM